MKLIYVDCPEYNFGTELDYDLVSAKIDNVIDYNFHDQNVIIRGIQSDKHDLTKDELIKYIIKTGTDKYAQSSEISADVNDKPIDLFGYNCIIDHPIVMQFLEGFHKFKPKCLEAPQYKIDIWMFYDASQLECVEYTHKIYNVKVSDGYIFKDPNNKHNALLGIIVIN